jgi:hypothetical protein
VYDSANIALYVVNLEMAHQASRPAAVQDVKLSIVSPGGPCLAYHVGWIACGALYVHGGIDKTGSKTPLGSLHRFDFDSGTWSTVKSPGSPSLSHHACVVVDNRYAVIIGGWNGRDRTCDVHIFDCLDARWSSPRTTGFPPGAGLSSHAAMLLPDGAILVVGREGSLRMQRRFGSAFMLRGNPAVGGAAEFRYAEHTVAVTSRSGHTMHVQGRSLVIIGGRDDKVIETHPYDQGGNPLSVAPCSVMASLAKRTSSAAEKPMTGRKNHASVCSSGVVFLHGGWTFDGRSRDPVGHMFALVFKPTIRWVYLGDSGIGRAGHVMCADDKSVTYKAVKELEASYIVLFIVLTSTCRGQLQSLILSIYCLLMLCFSLLFFVYITDSYIGK